MLITIFGPISGAHFNPIVTLAFAARRDISVSLAVGYIVVQVLGAILGVWMAHAMFGEAILQVSTKLLDGPALAFSEAVRTFVAVARVGASKRTSDEKTNRLYWKVMFAADPGKRRN